MLANPYDKKFKLLTAPFKNSRSPKEIVTPAAKK
jgi:hypothetical protein